MFFTSLKAEDFLTALKQDCFNLHNQRLEEFIARQLREGHDGGVIIDNITENMNMERFVRTQAYLSKSCLQEAKQTGQDLAECQESLIRLALAIIIGRFKDNGNILTNITAEHIRGTVEKTPEHQKPPTRIPTLTENPAKLFQLPPIPDTKEVKNATALFEQQKECRSEFTDFLARLNRELLSKPKCYLFHASTDTEEESWMGLLMNGFNKHLEMAGIKPTGLYLWQSQKELAISKHERFIIIGSKSGVLDIKHLGSSYQQLEVSNIAEACRKLAQQYKDEKPALGLLLNGKRSTSFARPLLPYIKDEDLVFGDEVSYEELVISALKHCFDLNKKFLAILEKYQEEAPRAGLTI